MVNDIRIKNKVEKREKTRGKNLVLNEEKNTTVFLTGG